MIYFSHLLNDEDTKNIIAATRMGLESIEFSISENLDRLDDALISYEKRLERMNCERLSLHGPFLDLNPAAFDSLAAEATRIRYEQSYRAAKTLGADRLILHTCFQPAVYYLEGWSSRVADFFRRFLSDKDDSVPILLENVLDPYPAPVLEAVSEIGHPAVGVCLDLGHAHCYSEVPCTDWLKTLAPAVRHLHIHDNCGEKDSHLALGSGTLPLQELRALPEFKKQRSFTIECSAPKDVLKTHEILRRMFPEEPQKNAGNC